MCDVESKINGCPKVQFEIKMCDGDGVMGSWLFMVIFVFNLHRHSAQALSPLYLKRHRYVIGLY